MNDGRCFSGDLDELVGIGRIFDERPASLEGRTAGVFLAETLLKVRTRTGACQALIPNRVQREFERMRGRQNVVLKARQVGISTWVAARFFLKTITQPGTLTVEIAHTQEAAEEIFRIVHRFYSELPEVLRAGALKTSRANARSLVFPMLDSEYRVESAADPNAGRGLTIQNLHCSEVARWPGEAEAILAGLRASMTGEAEVVLESTANGAYGCFYEEWTRAEGNGAVRHFFPWWWEESYRLSQGAEALTEEELRLANEHCLHAEQIAFRRRLRTQFGPLARQEYPETAHDCFLSSGSGVFDADAIDGRMRALPPATARWNGELLTWYPPMASREYLVAVDPAGGGSEGDFAAMQVVDLGTGLQCAEFRGKAGLLEVAERAAALAREYNGALLAVERNNHGAGVLAYLHSVCRYGRLYQQEGQDGWLTSTVTRPRMLSQLARVLAEQPEVWMSERLLGELKTFVRDAKGHTGAAAGQHDDCVMAMAMAMAIRAEC
ncbi:MAG: terminase [Acidobacteriaceae bacterium]